MTTFLDLPIWDFPINSSDPFNKTLRTVQRLEKLGKAPAFDTSNREIAIQGFTIRGAIQGADERARCMEFLRGLRGNNRAFWVRLPLNNFVVLERGPGLDSILIEGTEVLMEYLRGNKGFTDIYQGGQQEYQRPIEIYNRAGDVIRARVVSASATPDGKNTDLLLRAEEDGSLVDLPYWVGKGVFASYIYKVRCDSNEPELTRVTRDVAQYELDVVELPLSYDSSSSEELEYTVYLFDFWTSQNGKYERWRYTSAPFDVHTSTGAVLSVTSDVDREYWLNVEGDSLEDLYADPRYPNHPSGKDRLPSTEFWGWDVWNPQNFGNNYGEVMKGFIVVPPRSDLVTPPGGSDNVVMGLRISGGEDVILKVSNDHTPEGLAHEIRKTSYLSLPRGWNYFIYVWESIPSWLWKGAVKQPWKPPVIPPLSSYPPNVSGTANTISRMWLPPPYGSTRATSNVAYIHVMPTGETNPYDPSLPLAPKSPNEGLISFRLSSEGMVAALYINDELKAETGLSHELNGDTTYFQLHLEAGVYKVEIRTLIYPRVTYGRGYFYFNDDGDWREVQVFTLPEPSAGDFRVYSSSTNYLYTQWGRTHYFELHHKAGTGEGHASLGVSAFWDPSVTSSTPHILSGQLISAASEPAPFVDPLHYKSIPIEFSGLSKSINYADDRVDIRMADIAGNPVHGGEPMRLTPLLNLQVTEIKVKDSVLPPDFDYFDPRVFAINPPPVGKNYLFAQVGDILSPLLAYMDFTLTEYPAEEVRSVVFDMTSSWDPSCPAVGLKRVKFFDRFGREIYLTPDDYTVHASAMFPVEFLSYDYFEPVKEDVFDSSFADTVGVNTRGWWLGTKVSGSARLVIVFKVPTYISRIDILNFEWDSGDTGAGYGEYGVKTISIQATEEEYTNSTPLAAVPSPISLASGALVARGDPLRREFHSVWGTEVLPDVFEVSEPRVLFKGELESKTLKDKIWDMQFAGASPMRMSKLPTAAFSRRSSKYIYDRRVGGVDMEMFKGVGTVLQSTGAHIRIEGETHEGTPFSGINAFNYNQGLVGVKNPATGRWEYRTIRSATSPSSGEMEIHTTFPFSAAGVGDEVVVFPGCDNTVDAWGIKFGNPENFIGHPEMPSENPTITPVPEDEGGKGKGGK